MDARREGSPPDLSEHLTGLLDRATSISQFWSWFGKAQADIELFGSEDDNELANLIENVFAEYTGGYITAEELLTGLGAEVGREFPHMVPARQGVA
jgi:hypothetical protein